MSVNIIFAKSTNGVIGVNNALPWYLPEDLAHFKALTGEGVVIMGRRTWDSLSPRYRPLPNRQNIVVSQQLDVGPGYRVARSLHAAIELGIATGRPVWVIGGSQIFEQALPLADRVEVTEIDFDYAGDTFAPQVDLAQFELVRYRNWVSQSDLRCSFKTYERRARVATPGLPQQPGLAT
ncbi:dihydrofolate reductase [Comamonas thiooxydans]|uniref:dihydrofolate reductase n=1 Tax=Comamonas thiooxydans TaxID=363952 RepID=UPI000B40C6EA|nr:dihydrofolate reductase [Comamonas thiooxydans]